MNQSRRDFLRCAGVAVGSAAVAATIDNLTLTSALAQGNTGYKALVCIFLNGGNDANNMVIPYDDSVGYQQYLTARQAATLALTRGTGAQQLDNTRITPAGFPISGAQFALHPNMGTRFQIQPALLHLWNLGKLAVVCNVGPLVQPLVSPTPRAAAQNSANPKPYQLYSHADQQQIWQTSSAERHTYTGWGGRTADRFPPHASGFPLVTTIAGSAYFTI